MNSISDAGKNVSGVMSSWESFSIGTYSVTAGKDLPMLKKALLILIPFLLLFLFGVFLLLRPRYQAPIVEVESAFTRQEKTGQRSSSRHTVAYAVVKVAFEGAEHTLTVRDNTWEPLKAGDSVTVTRGLFGGLVEYRTKNAGRLMLFSAVMGPVCMLVFWGIAKRNASGNRREKGLIDQRSDCKVE